LLMGPKDREILESYGHSFDRLVDFGWFWFIASPMLWLLHRIHDVVRNYGIAIIVITVLLKLLTFPLNQTSMKSMRKMQQIQPQLQRLRDRHKDDPSAMQREMMELYKKHNVNPFSGCLPMIIQIPVFIALYNGLLRDIALRHAPFIGWINDLSAPDRLHVAGVGIPVLTLLMGASMLLQQLTAPAQGDPNQRRMMMIMPVVFTFMFLKFPSGLVLYWLVNNVISIGQQYLTLRTAT
jgi:YidC/Oxa1 family membrane protein insertase